MDGATGSTSPEDVSVSLYSKGKQAKMRKSSAGSPSARDKAASAEAERESLMSAPGASPEVSPPSYEDAVKTLHEPTVHPDTRTRPQEERRELRSISLVPITSVETRESTYDPESQSHHNPPSPNRSGRGFGRPLPNVWGPLQRRFKPLRRRRNRIILLSCVGGLLLLLFLILFPISFVKIEYNEIALMKTRSTGFVHRTPTYYSGCYVLGPDTDLVRFNATAHIVEYDHLEIFAQDGLPVDIQITFIYYLRGEELGMLYDSYTLNYDDVIRKVAHANIKNTASEFTVNSLRLDRQSFEQRLLSELQRVLGGTCCQAACESCMCSVGPNCTLGLHADVKQLMLTEIRIPEELLSRYLSALLLKEKLEEVQLDQEKILVLKETDRLVLEIENHAQEILANATAQQLRIHRQAQALGDKTIQSAVFVGWKKLCDRLDLTNQDHRLSALFIKSLYENEKLQAAVGFNSLTGLAGLSGSSH